MEEKIDISGHWVSFISKLNDKEVIVNEGTLTEKWKNPHTGEPKSFTFTPKLAESISLSGSYGKGYEVLNADEEYQTARFAYHTETVEGREIGILSGLTMEYDGRGRIATFEYVRKEDLEYINEDFVSKLKSKLNDRTVPPMMNVFNNPGGLSFGSMGMMGMQMQMQNMEYVPNQDSQQSLDPWTCSCGFENKKGKFCSECGNKRPQ